MRREPDISIDVYLKRPLDFSILVQQYPLEKREPNKEEPKPDVVFYKWRPLRTDFPSIVVSLNTQPLYHSVYVDAGLLEQFVEDVSSENLGVPLEFMSRLETEGKLVADRMVYDLLQKYPDIKKLLSDHKSFCNILEFTEGQPAYQATIELYDQASQIFRSIPFAIAIINALCSQFKGIASDEGYDKAGRIHPFFLARSWGSLATAEGEYSLQWASHPAAK